MRPRAVPLRFPALAFAVACESEPDPDFRLPWWPDPRVAAPSPILDAVGLAPPTLAGPGCRRFGPTEDEDGEFRAALRRLVGGFETTCFVPPAAASGAETNGHLAVTFDGHGRAWSADRQSGPLSSAAATAAADSIVRRGLALAGARALTCRMEGWPVGYIVFGGPQPVVRGWWTPDYQALVLSYSASGADTAGPHVVHLRVSRSPFAACQPRRGGAREASPPA